MLKLSFSIFEVARFCKTVVLHNNMTPELHEKHLEFGVSKYDGTVKLIYKIIEKFIKMYHYLRRKSYEFYD